MAYGQGGVFGSTANALQQAGQGAIQGMQFQPMQVGTQFASPTAQTSFAAPTVTTPNYNARQLTAPRVTSFRSVAAPQAYSPLSVAGTNYRAEELAGRDLAPYMNPYEQQVVQNVTRDLSEAQQLQQNLASAQAGAAGAFGGSRHALMEAETAKNYLRQVGDVTSQLRQQGFQQAQQGALADIAALNRAGEFGAAQQMQANLANQQAQARAAEFGRSQQMQASLANQAAQMQQGMANQQAALQALGMTEAGRQFGAQLGMQGNLANQQAALQALSMGQRGDLANQAAQMQAQQMGLQAALANQQAGLAGAGQRLSAGAQLADIANLGFGQGQAMQAGLANIGAQQQAAQQALINAARGQFGQFTQYPQQMLGLLQMLGSLYPGAGGQSQSYSPGLFDYLGLGAGMAGVAGNLGWKPFSDYRLKKDIQFAGKTESGINLYTWQWNDEAKRLGIENHPTYGVIAQELQKTIPSAVMRDSDGYLRVDYSKVF